jgi:hypothetical protein
LREKLKGGIICFGSQFKKFQTIVFGSVDSGPLVRQNIMVAGTCGRGCSPYGEQEAESGRDLGPGITFKSLLPVT